MAADQPSGPDLTLEQELRSFEALKARLPGVWSALTAADDAHCTSVVVPSLTVDPDDSARLAGGAYYEERLLFLLIRLRNPHAHVVYVTSQPVRPVILDYYLDLLVGVSPAQARARLTMLCCRDASPRPLTQKILERPHLIAQIQAAIPNPTRAYLTVFNSTPLERRLAVLLDIPLNGLDPSLRYHGTKSGSRHIFRDAKVPLPSGYEDLRDERDIEHALRALQVDRPGIRRAIVKLNEGFSGEGNAIVTYPHQRSGDLRAALNGMSVSAASGTPETYLERFRRMGGVVEELIEARDTRSPSAQCRTSPDGTVHATSTHDQMLGGPSGQTYLGCRFPADPAYRLALMDMAARVGAVLAAKGVVSRYGVDFLAYRDVSTADWALAGLEINLRLLGTTHPFLALSFLTGGSLNEQTGQFLSPGGTAKYYRATDNVQAARYRSLAPDDLIRTMKAHGLHYAHQTESGVLFHLLGALSEFGKLGVTAIGDSAHDVDALYTRALDILDTETA